VVDNAVITRAKAIGSHRIAGPVLKLVLAYIVLVEIGTQYLFGRIDVPGLKVPWLEVGRYPDSIPRGVLLGGAVIGALYGLIAMGLILVYRANRIINFAQAQLGSVPAVFALLLIARHGTPYIVAIPIMIIGAVVLGGVVEVTLVRRFAQAPRLILTVVTIGVGFLLLIFEFYVKQWLGGSLKDVLSLTFPTPFQHLRFRLGPTTLTGDHIFAIVVVAVIVLALTAFFRYTDIGIAVRASAENSERASLLGIPVKRVSTIVWILATVLSAIGVFLRTPLVGLPQTGFVGPSILLLGLAVAVIARMESMPTAFFAGMLIGVIERSAVFATRRSALADAVMFVVIVAALLIQRGRLSRALAGETSTWQTVREFRPIPGELRRLPEVVWGRVGVGGVVLALVLALPWILGASKTPQAAVMVAYAIIGVSLVILTGWAGQISLGQYGIAGVGSAVAGGLAANHHWDFFAAIFVGALAGGLVAVIVGLPALRIQGLFLAVTTLSFGFAVNNFVLRREFFGWLVPKDNHFVDRPKLYGRFDLATDSKWLWFKVTSDAKFYYVCLAFLLLALGMAAALRRNRSGRIFIGVRDNPRLMQAYGVNPALTRLAAFAISGFLAGMAGALLAYHNTVFSPSGFAPEQSIALFAMAVLGGVGSLSGALLGAVYLVGLPLLPGLRDVKFIDFLTSGLGLLLVLNFLPGGLAEGMFRIRDSILRRIAARHGLIVPSLVADSLVVETSATEHVVAEAAEEHDLVEVPTLACPECGEVVVLENALLHPHFVPNGRKPVGAPR
jgi:ABC-type branched-subunit amino acid transport system permease subunit